VNESVKREKWNIFGGIGFGRELGGMLERRENKWKSRYHLTRKGQKEKRTGPRNLQTNGGVPPEWPKKLPNRASYQPQAERTKMTAFSNQRERRVQCNAMVPARSGGRTVRETEDERLRKLSRTPTPSGAPNAVYCEDTSRGKKGRDEDGVTKKKKDAAGDRTVVKGMLTIDASGTKKGRKNRPISQELVGRGESRGAAMGKKIKMASLKG